MLPAAMRHGVGAAIVGAIERIAREHGIAELHLESSLTAEPFYTALGYRVEKRGELAIAPGVKMAAITKRKELGAHLERATCGLLNGMVDLSVSITCPACTHVSSATMPEDRCVVFYECPACGTVLRPKAGDCWVFCSYGDKRCAGRARLS